MGPRTAPPAAAGEVLGHTGNAVRPDLLPLDSANAGGDHPAHVDPARQARAYPHELSGGLRRRAGFAAALAGSPALLLADEPTTALDVTVLDLLGRHRETRGPAALLITHDIGLLHGRARRVAVMYGGRIVETGPTEAVTERPAHPYTAALLRSVPRVTGPLT
ncbi:ATP-binding cassette domain-containing protein [Streptomyces atratus]|uniref:ABC transporter ATP-binding protein n=1 Tax=Streptomyces atratus TaxID=1893 RepID=UPI00367F99EE